VEREFFDAKLADGVRFELTVRYKRTAVFKTAALNRSATHPQKVF
jgi:hypothetical protein